MPVEVSTQRGFTLIEVVIAVAIVAVTAAAGVGLTVSSRAFAVSTAAAHFDTLLDAARTTARDFSNGATIVFARDVYGDGTTARLYRNRPATGPLAALNTPPLEARVAITETESLHAAPFAITLHADGRITGIAGYTLGSGATAETSCPAVGAYHIHFAYAGATADRYIPCRMSLATTGPLLFATPPPAPTAVPITASTACSGNCPGIGSPTIPAATCPPGYVQQADLTCKNAPLLVNTGQGWASSASLSLIIGGTASIMVHEDAYHQRFKLSDNCTGAIATSLTSGGGSGPDSTYAVTASSSQNCGIVVTDDLGKSANVNVSIFVARKTQYVCSSQPANTDLGPDPNDPSTENYSNGEPCPPTGSAGTITFTVSDGAEIRTSQGQTVQPGQRYDYACTASSFDWETLYDAGEYAGPGMNTDTLLRNAMGGNVSVGSLRSTYYYDPGPISRGPICPPQLGQCGSPAPPIDPGPQWNWPPTWTRVLSAQTWSDNWADNSDPAKGSDPNSPTTYTIPGTSLTDSQLTALPDSALIDLRVIGIYRCTWDTYNSV